MLLVSEAEFSDSSVAYNTQCSSRHVPSFMPVTQLPLSPGPSSLWSDQLLKQHHVENNTVCLRTSLIFVGCQGTNPGQEKDGLFMGLEKANRFPVLCQVLVSGETAWISENSHSGTLCLMMSSVGLEGACGCCTHPCHRRGSLNSKRKKTTQNTTFPFKSREEFKRVWGLPANGRKHFNSSSLSPLLCSLIY